jgi:hypothetical protein
MSHWPNKLHHLDHTRKLFSHFIVYLFICFWGAVEGRRPSDTCLRCLMGSQHCSCEMDNGFIGGVVLQRTIVTHRDLLVNTPASCSGGTGFKSRHGNRLS